MTFYGGVENEMDVTSNPLSTHLNRIYTFLTNNDQTQVFSGLTTTVEDILVNIAEDANFLKHGMFDDDCKSLAAQITAVLEKNKQVFTLSYAFEMDDDCNKVMVYKKTPVLAYKVPLSLTQLRKPNSISTGDMSVKTNTVMSSFKASSLNATLKFVKDDSRLVLQYPNMSTEQAQFIRQMITQCMGPSEEMDTGPGSKGLFDPLAEALKIFSLKYDFRLNDAVPFSVDMKRLVFEKIPKQRKKKKEIDLNTSISSSGSDSDHKLHQITPLIDNVTEEFSKKTFLQIKNFITDDTECLTFEDVAVKQEQFLIQWKCYLKPKIRKWFSEEVQEILLEIEQLMGLAQGRFKLRTIMEKICGTRRNVYIKKRWAKSIETLSPEKSEKVLTDLYNINISMAKVKLETTQARFVTLKKPIAKSTENTQEVNKNTPCPISKVMNVNEPIEKVITVNEPIEKVMMVNEPIEKLMMVNESVRKVNDTEKVNKNTPLPLAKVKVENIEVNKITHSNPKPMTKVPIKKVMTENTKENENTLNRITSGKESSVEVNNNTILMPVEKVRTGKSVLVNSEDFIAIRNVIGTTKIANNKLRTLIEAIYKINSTFARLALQTLKEFISNPDKDTLSFKNLKWEELEFLLRWTDVIRRVEVVKLFSVEGQMVLDELRSLVDRCSGKFVVVVATKTVSPIDRAVTFMKQYSKKKQSYPVLSTAVNIETKETIECDDDDEISNASFSSEELNHTHSPKMDRFLYKIAKIHYNWIKVTLSQLLDFLKDDSRDRYTITYVTKAQKSFLISWQTTLSKPEVRVTFSEDIRRLLDEINYTVLKNDRQFSVSYESKKPTGKRLRDFTYIKKFKNAVPTRKPEKTKNNVNSKVIPVRLPPKVNSNTIVNIPNKTRKLEEMERLTDKTESTDDGNKDEITVAVDAPKSHLSDVCDTSRCIRKGSSTTSLVKARAEDRGRPRSANNEAKAKIIEALNQPLISERGLKMMKMMGWEGGALGARGEGIVEPITLNLEGLKRAGLGCPKPAKLNPAKLPTLPLNITRINLPSSSKHVWKTSIVHTIKHMILTVKQDHLATELMSQGTLPSKVWKFVRHIVCKRRDLLDSCENVQRVLNLMEDTDYILTACLSISAKSILLVLSKTVYKPTPDDSKYWSSVISFDTINTTEPKMEFPVDKKVGKLSDALAFRSYAMNVILEFCSESTDKIPPEGRVGKDINLNNPMVGKQMSYIKDTVVRLNNRSRSSSCSEQNVFEDILTKIMGYTLCVEFPTTKPPVFKCIRLHKVFDTHNTTISLTESNTETASKISIQSIDSNNKVINNNSSKTDINALNSENNTINQNTKEKRRTTFTNDTFDEKYLFDNQGFNDASQNVPIDSQNIPVDEQNVLKDSQNIPVDEQNVPKDSQNISVDAQNVPKDSQNIPVDEQNVPKDSQNIPVDEQNVPKDSQNIPVDEQNVPKDSQNICVDEQNVPMDNQNMLDSENVPIDWENLLVDSENAPVDIGKRRANFTNDTADDIYNIYDVQDSLVNQIVPIDNQKQPVVSEIVSIDNQNILDSENVPIDWENILVDSETVPVDSEKRRTTFTNDTFDEKYMFDNQDSLINQNVPIGDQKQPVVSDIVSIDNQNITVNTETSPTDSQNAFTDNLKTTDSINESIDSKIASIDTQNAFIESNGTIVSIIDYHNINKVKCKEDVKKTLSDLKECVSTTSVDAEIPNEHGKRSRPNTQTPIRMYKRLKNDLSVKKITITPEDYPQNKMTNKMAAEIQKSILNSIDYTEELPLLECHGIQDGALIYTCHNKKSFNLIESLTLPLQINIIEEKEKNRHKMTVKINSYIDESIDSIFDRLETYNMNLITKDWKVLKIAKTFDRIVIHLEIDDNSYKFIIENNFTLYAGTDQAKFSVKWD